MASSPTDSGGRSGPKSMTSLCGGVRAVGAEAGLGQLGERFRLAQEPGELAGRAHLFLRQPVPGEQHGGIVGHRGRPRRQPGCELVLGVGQRRARWKICCSVVTTACTGAAAGSPACSSASIAVDELGVGELRLPGHQRRDGAGAGGGAGARRGRRGGHGFGGQIGRVAVTGQRQRQPQRSPAGQVQPVQRSRVALQPGQRRPILLSPARSSAEGARPAPPAR